MIRSIVEGTADHPHGLLPRFLRGNADQGIGIGGKAFAVLVTPEQLRFSIFQISHQQECFFSGSRGVFYIACDAKLGFSGMAGSRYLDEVGIQLIDLTPHQFQIGIQPSHQRTVDTCGIIHPNGQIAGSSWQIYQLHRSVICQGFERGAKEEISALVELLNRQIGRNEGKSWGRKGSGPD